MKKPNIGDKVKLVGEQMPDEEMGVAVVTATYDRIDVWWDTAAGESKVALMDALDAYGPEKAATAEWYAEVEVAEEGGTLAVASFECEPA